MQVLMNTDVCSSHFTGGCLNIRYGLTMKI